MARSSGIGSGGGSARHPGDGARVPARLGRPDHRPAGDRRAPTTTTRSRRCGGSSSGEGSWEDRRRVKAVGIGLIQLYRFVFAGCRRAAATSRPAPATPSRRSRSTACSAAAGWVPGGSPAATLGIPAATTRSAERRSADRDPFASAPAAGCCSCSGDRALVALRRRRRARRRPRAARPGAGGAARAPPPPPGGDPARSGPPGPTRSASSRGCSRRSSRRSSSRWSVRRVTGNMAIAIILLTLLVRILIIPLFRRQIVSSGGCSCSRPEIKEIQRRYKGDRAKVSRRRWRSTRSAGSTRRRLPAASCQFILLIPMYSVIRDGLTNYDPQAMLTVFGHQIVALHCAPAPDHQGAGHVAEPVHRHRSCSASTGASRRCLFPLPVIGGLSLLGGHLGPAPARAGRMVMPPRTRTTTQSNDAAPDDGASSR